MAISVAADPTHKMLTVTELKLLKPRATLYRKADGRGLCIEVTPDGKKHWRFRYRFSGRAKMIGLGSFPETPLATARSRVDDARQLIARGVDPSDWRKAEKSATTQRIANSFESVAREWLKLKAHDWVPAHLTKETLRLEKHSFPWIGDIPIADLGVSDVRPLIERVRNTGHLEQAHRLREQLSRIFRYAIATDRAESDPAHALSAVLPARKQGGFPSIVKPAEIGELLRAIEGFAGTFPVACALRLAPLWFCRPGEIRMAEWSHFSLDGQQPEYRVPPPNRKLRKAEKEAPEAEPHIIPLSRQAIDILRELKPLTGHRRYLFPGARDPKRCMSEAAINAALARLGYKGTMVGHGFRHMASTRLEEMGWPDSVIESQLAHKIPGVRGKYKRDQHLRFLPERREMMQAWADYLDALRLKRSQVHL